MPQPAPRTTPPCWPATMCRWARCVASPGRGQYSSRAADATFRLLRPALSWASPAAPRVHLLAERRCAARWSRGACALLRHWPVRRARQRNGALRLVRLGGVVATAAESWHARCQCTAGHALLANGCHTGSHSRPAALPHSHRPLRRCAARPPPTAESPMPPRRRLSWPALPLRWWRWCRWGLGGGAGLGE